MKKLIKNQSGMSMVEILIVSGMFGFMAVVGMKMMDNQTTDGKRLQNRFALQSTQNLIMGALSSSSFCSTSLSGLIDQQINPVNPNTDSPQEFNLTSMKLGQKELAVNSKLDFLTFKKFTVKITDYANNDGAAFGEFNVEVEMPVKKLTMTRVITIPLLLEVDNDANGNTVSSCASSGQDIDDICNDLFGEDASVENGVCTNLTGVTLNDSVFNQFSVPVSVSNLENDVLIDSNGDGGTTTELGGYTFTDQANKAHNLKYKCEDIQVVKSSSNVSRVFIVRDHIAVFKLIVNEWETTYAKCPEGSVLTSSSCTTTQDDLSPLDPVTIAQEKTEYATADPPYTKCRFKLSGPSGPPLLFPGIFLSGRATATCTLTTKEVETETKRMCYLTINENPNAVNAQININNIKIKN